MKHIFLIGVLCAIFSTSAPAQTPLLDALPPGSKVTIERREKEEKPRKTNEVSAAVQCGVQADALTLKGKGRSDYIEDCLKD